MRGHSYAGKGSQYHPPPAGHRQRPVTYPQYLPIRGHPHSYVGEGALNVKMSTEAPPDWGPQSDLPYFSICSIGQRVVQSLQDRRRQTSRHTVPPSQGSGQGKDRKLVGKPRDQRSQDSSTEERATRNTDADSMRRNWQKYRKEKR